MKRLLIAATAIAAASAAAPAFAQDASPSWYGNLGYSSADFDDATLGAVTGRLGYKFNPNFAVEGEASIGTNDEDVFPGTSAKIDNQEAIYAVGFLPVTPQLDLFARVGYSRTELQVDGPGFTGKGDDNGVAYGAGAQWMFDDKNGVRGDFTKHTFQDNGDANVWSVSYVRKF